jgi:uncharacterized protein
MALREQFADALKSAMKAGETGRVSTLRMILAKIKDLDIAARPQGIDKVNDKEVAAALRGMIKSRRESVELYRQGNRPDLVAKEEDEIRLIESFLPAQMDEAGMHQAIAEAIAETGATGLKDMGKVMACLKTRHAASLDMAQAGPIVKARLASR